VPPRFTARERQVLSLLREGQPNREIADALGIDRGTVKAHIGRLLRKVGVSNRTALTVHPWTQGADIGDAANVREMGASGITKQ
jgi:DNA-binding NarL/FixJ family response regulator